MSNENRRTPIYPYQIIYSARYIPRSVEHEVLRYIQLNLNKLNTSHVMHVNFTIVAQTGNQRDFFSDSLKIKIEPEFLISSGIFFQS